MNFRAKYKEYFDREETRYSVLDSNGPEHTHEVDFEYYYWETNKNNKIREGDVFIYRRPIRGSEIKQPYFFGSGVIGEIIRENNSTRIRGNIIKSIVFSPYILITELNDFQWTFKRRRENWANFSMNMESLK